MAEKRQKGTTKKTKGVGIDLKESNKSVEQALRDLRNLVEEDIQIARDRRYRTRPTEEKRLRKKERAANVRRYNKYN